VVAVFILRYAPSVKSPSGIGVAGSATPIVAPAFKLVFVLEVVGASMYPEVVPVFSNEYAADPLENTRPESSVMSLSGKRI